MHHGKSDNLMMAADDLKFPSLKKNQSTTLHLAAKEIRATNIQLNEPYKFPRNPAGL